MIVTRTCTVVPLVDVNRNQARDSRPLAEFRDAPAYVLLGDPGSGKTTAFETEKKALGNDARVISARDFVALDVEMHPEWLNKTLFIDGLDEVRAGAADAGTPFDQVRKRLEVLGRPRFRLSCREADWHGDNDRERLEAVSPGDVTVLRLDPLTESEVVSILKVHVGIEDPNAFIESARKRRIDGLLVNPQTLKMLAAVVAGGKEWPESRVETFEQACLQLVQEHNKEHKFAGQLANSDLLLDLAGRLCAVHLISGIEGYTQNQGDPDTDFPSLEEIQYENQGLLQSVLSTKLFTAESALFNRFAPIHRHVGEFLGARYLARLIEDGLPARRVISLITGEDGIVVTGLRGLSAWLAAHCKNARSELIERDPVGVGLYGDIRRFSQDEKRAILKSLKREVSRLESIEMAAAFSSLATPDMEVLLRDSLRNTARDKDHQTFVRFLLKLLLEGPPLRGLSGVLFDIVYDDSRWPDVNVLALNAFIHCEHNKTQIRKLKTLLKEIDDGDVSDPENDLLGILLWKLFPEELPTSEIWNYKASENDEGTSLGYYRTFWGTGLTQKSSPAQIAELLDALCGRCCLPGSDRHNGLRLEHFPPMLLAKGLEYHGDRLDVERLYAWLNAFRWAHHYLDQDVGEVRSWLEQRPDLQKEVTLEGLKRHSESDDLRYRACEIQEGLFDASPPTDFGVWCLKQALEMASLRPKVAEHLLELAWLCHTQQRGHEGLSLELLEKHASKYEPLMTRLAQLRGPGNGHRSDRVEDRDMYGETYIDQRRRQEEEWLDHLRAKEAALRENRAAPILLHEIARIYFGDFYNFNAEDAPNTIKKRLRGEPGLIDATFTGLQGTVEREDIPELEEIIGIRRKGRMHALGWPFLASLAEADRIAPVDMARWDKDRIQTAIAFYYCTPHGVYRPKWYEWLLNKRPVIVADVQVQFARSELHGGQHSIYKLSDLVHDPVHAPVARLASLRLLRSFPTRCNTEQIEALDNLLWAALRHADKTSLKQLIERKLATKSMNVPQRVHWLAAAAILSPETHIGHLKDYVQGQERRIRYLVGFFPSVSPDAEFSLSHVELGYDVLEVIVALAGGYADPHQLWIDDGVDNMGGRFGPQLQAAVLVYNLIRRLAASHRKDASNALARLLAEPDLSRWHMVLLQARDSQRVIRRDATFRHPEIHVVCRTLDDREPANAADLAALLVDRLEEIARQIHAGNTDNWRQYWNEDPYGRPTRPKAENSCRDALLSDLRQRLLGGVDAQPEGQYARDKRADIRVSSGQDFQVPIEIKKNDHADLWTAIKTQLIAKYTRDPGAAGHGIYLVFWLGREYTTFPPSGVRPETPDELQEQLKATLSEEETHRISVRVINVSGEDADWREN